MSRLTKLVERLKRKEAEDEQREKANKIAERTAALAVKTILGDLQGHTLAAAAPVVFQAMCRKEGINVSFTDMPATDGRTIWLGPIDLTSDLAPVYVYGHGCHERHHVIYTDFNVFNSERDLQVRRLFNIIEDVRIDIRGQRDYNGYLIWRNALIAALEATGQAAWVHPESLNDAERFEYWLLLTLEVQFLSLRRLEAPARKLYELLCETLGENFMHRVWLTAYRGFPQCSTKESMMLARRIKALIDEYATEEELRFNKLQAAWQTACNRHAGMSDADAAPTPEAQSRYATSLLAMPQGETLSMFGADGEVLAYAETITKPAELDEAIRKVAFVKALRHPTGDDLTAAPMRAFQGVISHPTNGGYQFGDCRVAMVEPKDYPMTPELGWDGMREAFVKVWQRSTSLARGFQQALEARVSEPWLRTVDGLRLDDNALSGVATGDDRVFLKSQERPGKNTAVQILLDASGSMTTELFTLAKVISVRLFEALTSQPQTAAALALFPGPQWNGIAPVAKFQESVKTCRTRLAPLGSLGSTPIIQALFWASLELNQRRAERKIIFVLTDGTFGDKPVEAMCHMLGEQGHTVVMLGIGEKSTPVGAFTARVNTVEDAPKAVATLLKALTRDASRT